MNAVVKWVRNLGDGLRMDQNTQQSIPQWVFEKESPMGGAQSTAWTSDTLEGSDLSSEERIAREAIQNSVDATLDGRTTEMFVWGRTLKGAEVKKFSNLLKLHIPDSPVSRYDKLGLPKNNVFELVTSDSNDSLIQLTVIEDRSTFGLGYVNGEDHFRSLCLYLGQPSMNVDKVTGGAFGFGKAVYQGLSNCNTFIVYSVFEPSDDTNQNHARLFVCSSFEGHVHNGANYTGRAWFGISDTEGGIAVCNPIVDDEAHEMAQRLGFRKREPDDLGTSIMIIGSNIDMERFRKAVEDYWWPRLISGKLSVEMQESTDEVLPSPEPLLREDLKPYIKGYEIIEHDVPVEEDERKYKLQPSGGLQKGTLALKALEPDEPDAPDNPEDDTRFRNTVAIMRNNPRMVVEYLDTGGRQKGNFAGTFIAHPDSERVFRLSEPPSHGSWQPNSERLITAMNNNQISDVERRIVGSTINAIKRRSREFQKSISPSVAPTIVSGTRKLEQILGRIISGGDLAPKPPPPKPKDPFQLRINERRVNTNGSSQVVATVTISLSEDSPVDELDAVVNIRPTVVMDDNRTRSKSEDLDLSLIKVDNQPPPSVNGNDVSVHISKSTLKTVVAESQKFDRDMEVDLTVSVRRENDI